MDAVSQIIKERENKATQRHDFMDLLIELKNKGTLELDNSNGLQARPQEASGSEEKGALTMTFVFTFFS